MPDLGWKPQSGWNVNLGRDTDFIQTMTRKDGQPWPAGTVVTLRIGTVAAWPATITGPALSWNVDKAAVNALITGGLKDRTPCQITYTDAAGLDLPLTTGRVNLNA